MEIRHFLSDIDFTVQATDRIGYALQKFEESKTMQLAVLNDNDYLGFIDEEDALDCEDEDAPIHTLKIKTLPNYVHSNQHPYNALSLINSYQTSFLAVLNSDEKFEGVTTPKEILKAISLIQSQNDSGAIVVLELGVHDASLSHISRLVENENCRILNYATRFNADTEKIEMTIKLDKSEISALLSSFARQNYLVLASYNTQELYNDTEERYNQLMNYLNL